MSLNHEVIWKCRQHAHVPVAAVQCSDAQGLNTRAAERTPRVLNEIESEAVFESVACAIVIVVLTVGLGAVGLLGRIGR